MGADCNVGDTLTFENYDKGYKHLWLVATPPYGDPPQVIIVNITTPNSDSDKTVMLDKGDHPLITHVSAVYYTDAKIVSASYIGKYKRENPNDKCVPFDQKIIKRIQEGFENSPYVRPIILNFFKRVVNRKK